MSSKLIHQQQVIMRYLFAHAAIILLLPLFVDFYGVLLDYMIAAAIGAVILSIINRRYGRYLFWSTAFGLFLLKEIVISNIKLAWLILQPKPKLDPGIIAIPLTVTTGLEITVLSLAVASTPGTLVVELGQDAQGDYILYVHSLIVNDPAQLRAIIKEGFESKILRISQGATQ